MDHLPWKGVFCRVEIEVDQPSGSTYLQRWISKPDPASLGPIKATSFVHHESQSWHSSTPSSLIYHALPTMQWPFGPKPVSHKAENLFRKQFRTSVATFFHPFVEAAARDEKSNLEIVKLTVGRLLDFFTAGVEISPKEICSNRIQRRLAFCVMAQFCN